MRRRDVATAGPALAGGVIAMAFAVAGSGPAHAGADSFAPVRLDVRAPAVARLHHALSVTVVVVADASVLDIRRGALRVRVKLAAVCGGEFAHTVGPVVIDARLNPQPPAGSPFAATLHGRVRAAHYGVVSLCAYLEDEADARQFASTTDTTVDISRTCSVAANRYDRARRARARHATAARVARAARLRRRARAACGAGTPL